MKKISAIVINYNTAKLTQEAIFNLLKCEPDIDWEIILIDNASDEKISESAFKGVKIRFIYNQENLGFAKAVNQGLALASAKLILLLNSDMLVKAGAISGLADCLEAQPSAGLAGPQFFYPNGHFQVSSGSFPRFGGEFTRLLSLYKLFPFGTFIYKNFSNRWFFRSPQEVDWLSGGCLLLKKEIVDAIGELDENYFFGVEDVDYCFRAKQAGWKVIYFPLAEVVHYHGYSSGGPNTANRLIRERDGWLYFLKKNLPRRVFTRWLVRCAYFFRIALTRRK